MKYAKIILGIAIFGIFGYLIYWFATRKKTGTDTENEPLPLAPPAETGGGQLAQTDSGAGLAAINRRIGEIMGTQEAREIEAKVRAQTDILTGVADQRKGYYNASLARSPITSAKNVPFNLSQAQKDALLAFQNISMSSSDLSGIERLRGANRELFSAIGTAFVGNAELDNTDEFIRQLICQRNQDCGKKYRDMYAGPNIRNGGEKINQDFAKMSGAWYTASNQFNEAVKQKAISDLRGSGWKFVGFDQF